ncbi:serine/threonine-protein kinase [Ornithinimicrobium sufpigmenti]|uniref:serine/threonine-protein kinase n=1 Tax=Ornithinimicrobium sufpigmenti TaxID=2508882 RepID=UPI0015E17302|nr:MULTISPECIES: serine/threonine-protein kinase [unclassified Ornithinimicrobium]
MSTAPQVPGYTLTGQLGTGASATVWRGRRVADGLPVAVKVVAPVDGRVDEALREAGLLARVRHQHVVHLYDVLPLRAQDGDPPAVALVTQLAGGGSLAQVLGRRRLLSPGELVTVLQPVAGALADLHRLGVVHGDLSTGNIVFREDGMPLLADLGTARIVGEQRLRGVGTGAGDGMVAPEVVEGFPATQESDVYQVGALARLALTGQVPGPGFDRPELAEVAPDLPGLLVDLVERCMAGAPEDRPDADELAVALHAVAPPEPVEVAPDADAAHGLTQRLRQVAQEDEAARAGREQRGAHRPERVDPDGRGPGTGRHGPRRPGARRKDPGRQAGGRQAGGGQDGGQRTRAVVGLAVGALLLVMLAGVGWSLGRSWWGGSEASEIANEPDAQVADAESGAAEDAAGVSAQAVPSPPPPAQHGPDADGEAVDADAVRQVVQDLVSARARAWEATDPGLLTTVLAAGSPVHDDESAELSRAREAGITYPRVGFEVRELAVQHEDPDRLHVEVTVVREPLEARDGGGWVLRTPSRSERVALELVRQEGRWLLWSWAELG